MNRPLWTPSSRQIEQSNMTAFMRRAERDCAQHFDGYPALYRWSVNQPEAFWEAVWKFCEIRCSHPWRQVLQQGDAMPGARWFTGSRLNFAENLLHRRDQQPALVFVSEQGERRSYSYADLYQQVARLADALKQAGVRPGDRIAAVMPNMPETVIAMLAASSLGAIWSSCSPDFGAAALLDRFAQIEPRIVFAVAAYRYSGKCHSTRPVLEFLVGNLDSIEHCIVVPFADSDIDELSLDKGIRYADLIATGTAEAVDFVQLPFDHPLYILFSSGTTGRPKCIVHGAGGTLIQHLKELRLHTDLKPLDRIFYFTTCGWMMWNWLVSSLALGVTVVLYDGSPWYPGPERLFDLAQAEGITIFGTSAKYLSAIEKAGLKPRYSHPDCRIRTILSTGSPLLPTSFDYVYRDIDPQVQLSSISGGTDIVSCFALGNPLLPVYRGELQCRGLGMGVKVFDEAGKPLDEGKGELVCTRPFPSMPVGFWKDAGQVNYRAAYFARYPGVWAHGDFAEITCHGGVIIHGRSDAVLNPGGVRIGTAEIYRQVEQLPEISESLAVGQQWQGDERILLFVRLREGLVLDQGLAQRIRQQIRTQTTPRHVPARILQVADLPRTRNNKIAELAVRQVIHRQPVKNSEALANPEALEQFKDLPALNQA